MAGALHDAVGVGIAHSGLVPGVLGHILKGQLVALFIDDNGVLAAWVMRREASPLSLIWALVS